MEKSENSEAGRMAVPVLGSGVGWCPQFMAIAGRSLDMGNMAVCPSQCRGAIPIVHNLRQGELEPR